MNVVSQRETQAGAKASPTVQSVIYFAPSTLEVAEPN